MAGRVDPYKNFRFVVEIQGIQVGGFSECTGFGSSVEVVEYREGGEPSTVRKLPAKITYSDITLKWGVTDSRAMYDWHLSAIEGKVERKDGSIILKDDAGEDKVRWNFFNAWMSKYDAADLNAKGNDVAIDTATITVERLERVK
jgi:phage tail-like protein